MAPVLIVALLLSVVVADGNDPSHLRAKFISPTLRSSCKLHLDMKKQQISVDNQVWLTLGRKCVRRDGEEMCVSAPKTTDKTTGSDALGDYHESLEYMDVGESKQWKLGYRFYDKDPTTLKFRQSFLDNFNDTSVPANSTIMAATIGVASWFPSFSMEEAPASLGYFEFNGMFIGGVDHQIGRLSQMQPNDALQSGPIAFFNDECVVVLSAANSFMSTSSLFRKEWNEFGYGVLGSITSIPQHYETSVIASSYPRKGPTGIRDAFTSWGAKLQKLHNTNRMKDVTLDYLQYSTDNGAYYYYHHDVNKTYQETILALKDYIDNEIHLPVRSWLMDSWFYYKGADDGVKEWTARPDIFPDGLSKLRKQLNWLTMAHNRYWSTETIYAKQNGGKFEFAMDEKAALPLEEAFWDFFFDAAKHWGLDVYEQDWLNVQTQSMDWTLQTVRGAENWLLQMGRSAKRHNLAIQYCMSWPRHILQSLQVDAVTQARASGDVLPDNERSIQLGVTSMVSFALGVAPHKDSFWSTPQAPPGNRYKHFEHASKLLAIIATYSTGPVAPSDYKELLNVDLIMKSCSKDGTLLKPDEPAVRTDTTILAEAGMDVTSDQRHQVWSTRTTLSGYTWTYILAANSPPFKLSLDDVYPSNETVTGHVAWSLDQDSSSMLDILPFPGTPVPASNRTHCHVYAIAPIFPNGWAFLGEANTKWTAVSGNRFSNLQMDQDGFTMLVKGAPEEVVILWLNSPSEGAVSVNCQLSVAGQAVFTSIRMECLDLDQPFHGTEGALQF